MSELIKAVTDSSFEVDVLQADKPVLVDFWAPWCGPCKSIAPILEELAQEYQGKVHIVKLNVDENSDAPAKYGVRGIPSLILFKDGGVAGTKVGMQPKSQLAAFLNEHII
jgi:thioredoxin 1